MTARSDKSVQATPFEQAATPDSEFVRRSLYFRQIKTFLEVFPQENILIKIYEDKEVDPVGFIQEIFEFLDIDKSFVPPSVQVQTKPGALENINKWWSVTSRILLHPQSPLIFKKIYSKLRPKWNALDIHQNHKRKLARLFEADIKELEKFLNRDLRCWKSKFLNDP